MALPLTDEEREYMRQEGGKSRMPLTDEDRAYLAGEEAPTVEAPTTGEKAAHVAGSWVSGLLDVADLPAYAREGGEAFAGAFPKTARVLGNLPFVKGQKALLQALPEGRPTEYVPGLKQAREASDALKLPPEQLEQAPFTEAAGIGAEWFGAPGMGPAARGVVKGTRVLPQALREAGVAAATSAGAAAGSTAEQYMGGEGTIGEMIGGLTGLVGAIRSGRVGKLNKSQREMLGELRKRFDSDEEMVATIQRAIDSGDVGTLTDLTRNVDIANVEAALARTPQGQKRIAQTLDKRVNKIYDDVTETLRPELPPARPGDTPADAARVRSRAVEADIASEGQERLTQAAAQADAEAARLRREAGDAWTGAQQRAAQAEQAQATAQSAREAVTPPGRPDEYSSAAAGKYQAAEADHKVVTRQLWDEFDASGDMPSAPYKAEANDYLQGLDPAEQDALLQKYGKYFQNVEDFQSTVSPRALSLRVQQMKADINNAAQRGDFGWEEKTLQELVDRFENLLVDPVVGNPSYRAAVEATKEGYDRFGPGYINDVRKAEPEEFLARAGLQGPRGAATARLLNESKIPELQSDVSNTILAEASRAKNLDEQFLINYEAVLDNLDAGGYNTRAQLLDLIEKERGAETALAQARAAEEAAQSTSKRATSEQDRLNKALEAQEKSVRTKTEGLIKANQEGVLAQYGKGFEEADAVIDDMLAKPDGPERLRELRALMEEVDTAQGTPGAKLVEFDDHVRRRVVNRLFDLATEGTPKQARTALREYRNMQRRLVREGILDEAQGEYLDSVLARAETEAIRTRGKANVGDIASTNTEQTNLISSMLASVLLAPLPGAYNLQLGGAVRRYFKTGLEIRPTRRNIKALTEYMTDPEAFLRGIEKLKTPEAQAEFVLQKLVGTAQAADILAQREEVE